MSVEWQHPLRGEDKLLHALAYAVLMLYYTGIVRPRYYVVVIIGLMALGVGIEFLQGYLSYRVAESMDIAANATGLTIGLVLGLIGLRAWARKVEVRFGGRSGADDGAADGEYHSGRRSKRDEGEGG